jgi:hypothetical protein
MATSMRQKKMRQKKKNAVKQAKTETVSNVAGKAL